jgi:hypothetical protein
MEREQDRFIKLGRVLKDKMAALSLKIQPRLLDIPVKAICLPL